MAGTPEGTGGQGGVPSRTTVTPEGGPSRDPQESQDATREAGRGSTPGESSARRRPGRRLDPDERSALVGRLGQRYTEGASIRQIAGEEQLSYGFVHRLLTESGAQLRGRGGSTRRQAAS